MNKRITLLVLVLVVLTAALTGCGDDITCGEGTVEMGGTCVASIGTCARGTVLMGTECVPDGTVICAGGTSYDMMTGTCVPDISECSTGTVLVDGACVPFDDTLIGDLTEGPEPNDALIDGATPGTFDVPAVGETVSFGGCVTPVDWDSDGTIDADYDSWTFSVTGPTMLDIQIDGRGGLSAGFLVAGLDTELVDDSWIRIGANLVSDGAQRKVLLPKAGMYALSAADARALLLGEPAGGPDACYYMQVTQVAMPEPTALTDGTATGTIGDPRLLSMTGTEGQLLFGTLTTDGPGAVGAIVQLVNDDYAGSAVGSGDTTDSLLLGLGAGDSVVFVVDHVYDISLMPVGFDFEVTDAGAVAYPPDGSVTITHSDEAYAFLYFRATEGDVVHVGFDGGGTDYFAVSVVSPEALIVSQPCAPGGFFTPDTLCTDTSFWLPINSTGTHYLRLANVDGVAGTDYTVDVTRTSVMPATVTLGTAGSVSLTSADRGFFVLDVSGTDWLSFNVENLVNVVDVDAKLYDPSDIGALDVERAAVATGSAGASSGFGRITMGDSSVFLVSVEDAAGHDGDESFDFVVDNRMFTDLGSVTEAMAIAPASHAYASGETLYFLVHASAGSQLSILGTPGGMQNIRLHELDAEEATVSTANAGAAGAAETLVATMGAEGWLAFSLDALAGAAGMVSIGITAIDPPYTGVGGTLPHMDVCTAGVEVLTGADDDVSAAIMLDSFTFNYFGAPVTEMSISSNGWLTFEAGYSGSSEYFPSPLPDATAPASLVAPYWDDLTDMRTCVLKQADRVVVQWDGASYWSGDAAQMQVVLHADGSFDFIYGADHALDGTDATVGFQNADGTVGIMSRSPTLPSTSITYTPR